MPNSHIMPLVTPGQPIHPDPVDTPIALITKGTHQNTQKAKKRSAGTELEQWQVGGESPNSDGRGVHRRALERFCAEPAVKQHAQLRDTWKEVAMGVALRAKAFATTCKPSDFGRLYQLVMSGAVSIDKAFPPKEQVASPRLVVNLFGSLGERAARIAIPAVPVIDITPTVTEAPDGQAVTVQPVGKAS